MNCEKEILRKEMKLKLKNIGVNKIKSRSEKLHSSIIDFLNNNKAKNIMLYYSKKYEFHTIDLLKLLLENKKYNIFLPKLINNKIQPIKFYCFDNCIKNKEFNVYEPENEIMLEKEKLDIVFVPGLAFNSQGYRIGYGGGYYDKFLKDCECIKVGLGFKEQVLDFYCVEEHDIKLDKLFIV